MLVHISFVIPIHASDLSKALGIDINLGKGTVTVDKQPCEALGVPCVRIDSGLENILRELQAQGGAPVLAGWIIQSRNDALRGRVFPIPAHIRQQLNGFYDQDLLDRARYKIGDNGLVNLGRLAPLIGGAGAITLIDVIIFNNIDQVNNDISLWVHELKHVEQYRDWGVHNFAIRYLRDPPHDRNPVENDARNAEQSYRQWRTQQSAASQSTNFQSGHYMQECGCWGLNPNHQVPEPRCASGWVVLNVCQAPPSCAPGYIPYSYICS
ncbi:MAG: hypothetical protein FCKEOINB_01843 [Nitrosomonas sp.]|nr:hypothetical protein [Nitrosomonas sp.]